MGMLNFDELKRRQRQERADHHPNLALRVHRALSWLQRAEQSDDNDGRFVFLWIAFNAAYAQELGDQDRPKARKVFEAFMDKLVSLDQSDLLAELVWTEFAGSIRVLLANPYVFQPFWDSKNGKLDQQDWRRKFDLANRKATAALGRNDTGAVLSIVLSRLYVLRNQLVHGGATWNSAVNRDQLRDCTAFLAKLVPLVIHLMLDNPNTLWGDACYPVIN